MDKKEVAQKFTVALKKALSMSTIGKPPQIAAEEIYAICDASRFNQEDIQKIKEKLKPLASYLSDRRRQQDGAQVFQLASVLLGRDDKDLEEKYALECFLSGQEKHPKAREFIKELLSHPNFSNYFSFDFIAESPEERMAKLEIARYEDSFIELLKKYKGDGLSEVFLRNCVNNDHALIEKLKENRLGQHFLWTPEERAAQERGAAGRLPLAEGGVIRVGGPNVLFLNGRMEVVFREILQKILPSPPERTSALAGVTQIFNQNKIAASSDAWEELRCPITRALILKEVLAVEYPSKPNQRKIMQFYDKEALEEWLKHNNTDPLTRQVITPANIRLDVTPMYREKVGRLLNAEIAQANFRGEDKEKLIKKIFTSLGWGAVPVIKPPVPPKPQRPL